MEELHNSLSAGLNWTYVFVLIGAGIFVSFLVGFDKFLAPEYLVALAVWALLSGWLPGKPAILSYMIRLVRDQHFRTYIVPSEWHSISVRV